MYAELPEVGASSCAGESAGELESVKAVSMCTARLPGRFLRSEHWTVLRTPSTTTLMGRAGCLVIRVLDASELKGLMSAEAYQAFCCILKRSRCGRIDPTDRFVERHNGPCEADVAFMLEAWASTARMRSPQPSYRRGFVSFELSLP